MAIETSKVGHRDPGFRSDSSNFSGACAVDSQEPSRRHRVSHRHLHTATRSREVTLCDPNFRRNFRNFLCDPATARPLGDHPPGSEEPIRNLPSHARSASDSSPNKCRRGLVEGRAIGVKRVGPCVKMTRRWAVRSAERGSKTRMRPAACRRAGRSEPASVHTQQEGSGRPRYPKRSRVIFL